jgi:hypothetical protein
MTTTTTHYPIHCILPHDRFSVVEAAHVTAVSDDDMETFERIVETIQHRCIHFYPSNLATSESIKVTYQDLATRFNFQYSPFLVFLHEKELRNMFLNRPDEDENDSFVQTDGGPPLEQLRSMMKTGFIHPNISVRHVGLVDGIDVGCGLFADEDLPADTFVGEYVGIVHATSGATQFDDSVQATGGERIDRLAYTCQFPSCDNGLGINAAEYGNIIRFANHSVTPNAMLKYICGVGGMMHVICVSSFVIAFIVWFLNAYCGQQCVKDNTIAAGDQLFIDYGSSYWLNKQTTKVQIQ